MGYPVDIKTVNITTGTWHFAFDLAKHELATTGTFVWAA